ncbi:hypothetical protein H6P81_019932 [Aristolochia fimbriata]|uniref:Uncharacterized protein n=1 Tax=Aristolochia fimbriata TaxID=158543 RepID=A0AAV7DX15_ARIFI|nr:hypothetical protein H6P81_019932 [Aristolochia fimbriata]
MRCLTLSVPSFLPDDPLVEQCEKRLRDVSYLKRDELLRIYIAKATGIVAAYGFPVAAKEYPQQLGVDACIRLFEQFKSYEGSYFFLWTYLCSRLDPDIHFMYIEGAAKTGQIKDVKVSYPLPCMPTTCFDILKDMGKKFHQGLTLSVRSFLPDDRLVEQCEKRLIDAIYLKRDELLRIYIAKATGIVSAYGFPVAAKEYPQPLGVDACIRLFEQFKSYEGPYFFLGTYLSSRLDPDIHFKHIEGAAKTG